MTDGPTLKLPSFAERFHLGSDIGSPFCVGLDPSASTLSGLGLNDDTGGLRMFADRLIPAAAGLAVAVKMQVAFFERLGPDGMIELQHATALARDHGLLVILDAKRGDIGSTAEGYAAAYFGPNSPFKADAMTASAYLGFDALRPILDRAAEFGGSVFVVALSSNPEGAAIQTALLPERGITVAQHLAERIVDYNDRAGLQVAGAVVGATAGDAARPVLTALAGRSLVLAPGIGAQGASFEDVQRLFGPDVRCVVPTISRGILNDGLSHNAVRAAIADGAKAARTLRSSATSGP